MQSVVGNPASLLQELQDAHIMAPIITRDIYDWLTYTTLPTTLIITRAK